MAKNEEQLRRKVLFKQYMLSEDYQETLILRLQLNSACESGDKKEQSRAHIWNLCEREKNPAEGCIFFIENFGYTYDPRPHAIKKHMPFILFDFQKDAIRDTIQAIENGEDALVEKSRDMGMSWLLFVYIPLWYWLFRDGTNFLLGSYKEALVDDKTPDSLFGKLDYAFGSLPRWIMPKDFNKNKHRNHMRLMNPATNNVITGDTMNPDFGRGSRKTAILFDELAYWDYSKDAWESSGDSTATRIANSTPYGYNFFAMLREGDIGNVDVQTYHWKMHPLKDQRWYEAEKERKTPEAVARELDISYSNSLSGRVYPSWNEEFVHKGIFEYERRSNLYVGWDFGKEDDTAIIWAQPDDKGRLRIVDTYRNNNKNIDFYIPFITGLIPNDGYSYTPDDMAMIKRHSDWKRAAHFGDPAGRFRNSVVDSTVFSILNEHNIKIHYSKSWNNFEVRRSSARRTIRAGINLNKNETNDYFNICMLNAAYPQRKSGGREHSKSDKPNHDWTSHYRSAFEYLCLGIEGEKDRNKKPSDRISDENIRQRKSHSNIGY